MTDCLIDVGNGFADLKDMIDGLHAMCNADREIGIGYSLKNAEPLINAIWQWADGVEERIAALRQATESTISS